MVFQEVNEDGTTRTYEEKIDGETCDMLITLKETDCTLFDQTDYDNLSMELTVQDASCNLFEKTNYENTSMDLSFQQSRCEENEDSLLSLDWISSSESTDDAIEQSRRDNIDSTCLSLMGTQTEATDMCDSILVFAEEKSLIELTYEEEEEGISIKETANGTFNTTFVASIFDGTCSESELDSADGCFDFIENSIFSKLPSSIEFSSIDPKLIKYIVDLNDDSATTSFMKGNFLVHLKYSITDADKTEVLLENVSIECLIDKKIAQDIYAPLSEYSVHLLTKPRDEKFIKIIKKTVATCMEKFTCEFESQTNSLSNIINNLRKMLYNAEALFVDLCNVCRFHEWKIINDNIRNFEIAFEVFGLRYSLWLVLSFDLLGYPSNTIKVKFGVHKADLKLYPYHLFHKVMRSVPSGTNDYISQIVKTSKKFILDWRHNHAKKSIRLSIHPIRRPNMK